MRAIPAEERGRAKIDFDAGSVEILPVELPTITVSGWEDELSDGDASADVTPVTRGALLQARVEWPVEISLTAVHKHIADLVAIAGPAPERRGGRPPHRLTRRMTVIATLEIYCNGCPDRPAELARAIADRVAGEPDAPDAKTVLRFVADFLQDEAPFVQEWPDVCA